MPIHSAVKLEKVKDALIRSSVKRQSRRNDAHEACFSSGINDFQLPVRVPGHRHQPASESVGDGRDPNKTVSYIDPQWFDSWSSQAMPIAVNDAIAPTGLAARQESNTPNQRLRLVSYNIQAGVASTRLRHYLTKSWCHILPHAESFSNLDKIAALTTGFDLVALQEVDAGSLRSLFINQVEYLAERGGFPFWYHQTNRNFGKLAQMSNGLLSRFRPTEIVEHRLPGVIPGRGAIVVRFQSNGADLVIILVHLALGKRARMKQLDYLSEIARPYTNVVVMGDLNCQIHSPEMVQFIAKTNLTASVEKAGTFPSWRPYRDLDHILTTPTLKVINRRIVNHLVSDHLPVSVEIELPPTIRLTRISHHDRREGA